MPDGPRQLWMEWAQALVATRWPMRRAQIGDFATVDAAEAFAAFARKRQPSSTGWWTVPRSEREDA